MKEFEKDLETQNLEDGDTSLLFYSTSGNAVSGIYEDSEELTIN